MRVKGGDGGGETRGRCVLKKVKEGGRERTETRWRVGYYKERGVRGDETNRLRMSRKPGPTSVEEEVLREGLGILNNPWGWGHTLPNIKERQRGGLSLSDSVETHELRWVEFWTVPRP